jgi:type IV pilus assembly protein PilM
MALSDWRKKLMGEATRLVHQFGPPIAVDFGAGALKVLQIADIENPSLVGAASLPTPDELAADPQRRIAFQIEALPRLIKSAGLKGKRAACAIPACQSICKHLQFQLEPGANVASIIRATVPAQLGCDASALVFRHIVVGPIGRSGKTEVICMAAAREFVERLMKALRDAKLEPVGMHMEYTAGLRAFDSITQRSEDDGLTSLYLDIGMSCSKVMIAHGRNLAFARKIDLGGVHMDAVVAKQLKAELGDARVQRLKLAEVPRRPAAPVPAMATASIPRDGEADTSTAVMDDRRNGASIPYAAMSGGEDGRPGSEPEFDLTEPLEILTDEISMCLRYHDSLYPERRIDRAVFVGGEARHLGLRQHVARTLRLPAQVADPMAAVARTGSEPTIGVDFRIGQPGWAVPLGLCLSPTDL